MSRQARIACVWAWALMCVAGPLASLVAKPPQPAGRPQPHRRSDRGRRHGQPAGNDNPQTTDATGPKPADMPAGCTHSYYHNCPCCPYTGAPCRDYDEESPKPAKRTKPSKHKKPTVAPDRAESKGTPPTCPGCQAKVKAAPVAPAQSVMELLLNLRTAGRAARRPRNTFS